MKGLIKKFHLGQKGFTLIELLVVIAILGILAAVAIPNLASLIGRGDTQAALTELSIIQTNMVAYMGANNLNSVTAQDTAIQITTSHEMLGTYMVSNSGWTYTWDTAGKVTQDDKYVAPTTTTPPTT